MAKPNDFLRQPVRIRKETVNFKEAELPGCDGLYATVLDDCFTKSECEELVAMAEAQTNGVWEEALVNVGTGKQRMIKEVRDCGRIIWDDADIVARIWDRVKDQVLPDIEYLRNVPLITGNGPTKRKETWRASRLNERMRFLKYGKGQYFNGESTSSLVDGLIDLISNRTYGRLLRNPLWRRDLFLHTSSLPERFHG